MRLYSLLSLLAVTFLTGCAHEGVIVQKNTSPSPFYHSLGIDGSFAFLLKDRAGLTRRQIVTPDVFSRYAVGDYFNDLQPGSSGRSDSKEMKAVASINRLRTNLVRNNKRTTTRALAAKVHTKSKAVTRRIAAGKATRTMVPARRTTAVTLATVNRTMSKTPAVIVPVPLTKKAVAVSSPAKMPALSEAEFVFLNVARCR